jgi:hypothetical protein
MLKSLKHQNKSKDSYLVELKENICKEIYNQKEITQANE